MLEEVANRERILVIDDEKHIRKILCEVLEDYYDCASASSAEEGLDVLRSSEFSLVISDVSMGGLSGLEMVPQILALAPDTVVIMMSGAKSIETAIDAMRVGAFDYLMKPFDLRHVDAAVRRALEYRSLRLAKQQYENQLEQMVEQRTAELRKTTKALEAEIAERNKAEERINYLAYYDALTNLPNRTLCKDRLEQALSAAQREGQILAVLFLSLDRLKKINDTLGPAVAEKLLCLAAERFRRALRDADTLAYWDSNEFAVIIPQLKGTEDAVEIARRLQSALEYQLNVDSYEFYLTSSIGIGLYPLDGSDAETLIKNAGAALDRAREQSGNKYHFYTADMNEKALKRLSLENELRRALDKEEFTLYYQPKLDTATLEIRGAEALIRWRHPELGLVSPAEFISLAEDTGLIIPIGEWTLRVACSQLKAWHDEGFGPLSMAVNLSPRQFEQPELMTMIVSVLEAAALDPKYLELEVTEGSLMKNAASASSTLGELRDLGVKISLDDFGTGFSSLGYLKRLPLDALKIDKSFVNDATTDPADASLVMAIITLAHNLRLKVIAEGVETEEQLRFLHLLRCDEVQGYLISKPLPASEFKELLTGGRIALQFSEEPQRKPHAPVERRRLISAA